MLEPRINTTLNFAEKRRIESIQIIVLLGILGSWILTIISLYLQIDDPHYTILTVVSTISVICLTVSFFFSRQNKITITIWIFIFTTEIIFITISSTIAEIGIILAIVLLVVISNSSKRVSTW